LHFTKRGCGRFWHIYIVEYPTLSIYLFASIENRKKMFFGFVSANPQTLAVDALKMSLENLYAYVYSPICPYSQNIAIY
jgi:hypothetical protein